MSEVIPSVEPIRACYVHVPFCTHRCGYCDFTLIARRPDLVTEYLLAIQQEMQTHPLLSSDRVSVDTMFWGGGTPTYLDAAQLTQLGQTCLKHFRLLPDYEWSVEANPFELTDDRLDALVSLGVNRVSLGVQSFDSSLLKLLERDHSDKQAEDAVVRLLSRFQNVGIDLIFGIPGQSLDDWKRALERAVSLGVQHISTYGLTFEAGTVFWSRKAKGQLQPLPDELEREMYEYSMEYLPQAGYPQYEISNFARPGFESRHNQTYWRSDSYFGFGPGAASYLHGVRQTNHRSVTTWIRRILAGESAVGDREQLAPLARAREAVMLGLRPAEGIAMHKFHQRFGVELPVLAGGRFEALLQAELLEIIDGYCRLTPAGRCLTNSVVLEFFES